MHHSSSDETLSFSSSAGHQSSSSSDSDDGTSRLSSSRRSREKVKSSARRRSSVVRTPRRSSRKKSDDFARRDSSPSSERSHVRTAGRQKSSVRRSDVGTAGHQKSSSDVGTAGRQKTSSGVGTAGHHSSPPRDRVVVGTAGHHSSPPRDRVVVGTLGSFTPAGEKTPPARRGISRSHVRTPSPRPSTSAGAKKTRSVYDDFLEALGIPPRPPSSVTPPPSVPGPSSLVRSPVPPRRPSPFLSTPRSHSPTSRAGEPVEEADCPTSSTAYSKLRRMFLEFYPESFSLPPPRGSGSVLTRGGGEPDKPSLPPLVLADRAKEKLSLMDSWLSDRSKSEKPRSGLFPAYLRFARAKSYQVGEAPGLCPFASSGPNFSNLVDSFRRQSLSSARVSYTQSEIDSQARAAFRIFEILSFMEWCLGVLGKLVDSFSSSASSLSDFRDFLLVVDRAVGDALGETSVLFTNFVLKKRELFCSFLSRSFVANERSSLLYSPLSKDSLFPPSFLLKLSTELLGKDTHDSVVRPHPPPPPIKQKSPLDVPRFRRGTSRTSRRSGRGARDIRRGPSSSSRRARR